MKKEIASFIILIFFSCFFSNAQSPNWIWARSIGTPSFEFGESIITDANGNVYMTGNFSSFSNYPIIFGQDTLTSTNNFQDVFIVKYDSNGNALWAKKAGGTSNENPNSIVADQNGNIFISGVFYSPTITFETITLTNANTNSADVFIAKYDSNGNILWAKNAGDVNYGNSPSVTIDLSGNAILTGCFSSPTINFGTILLTNTGLDDIFLVKYDTNGNEIWARSTVGTDSEYGNSITTDQNNNIYVTGCFLSPTLTFDTIVLTKSGYLDLFIVKYDMNGNVTWAKREGGTGFNSIVGTRIASDIYGNIFVAGGFSAPSITIGTTTLNNVNLYDDILLVKYDTNGNVIWANSEGGNKQDRVLGLSTNSIGDVIIAGNYESDSINFGSTTITNVGNYDIYIAKYDSYGNRIWTKSAGGLGYDYCYGMCIDGNDNIFITGAFAYPIIAFDNIALISSGNNDSYIAKLDAVAVGIKEQTISSSFSIAPNPFTSETIINFSEEKKNTIIKITDILGKEIRNSNFSGKQFVIERNQMKLGMYLVQIIDDKKNVITKKIVLQ
jgi:hypothetical protein